MRVALVTGGTAGIGAATAEALQAAGYRVAVNYGTNEAVAQAFSSRTGIHAFAWNVADPVACREGAARVQAELGPIEVLVNNAGITRDAMLHKMSFEQRSDGKRHWIRVNIRDAEGKLALIGNPVYLNWE